MKKICFVVATPFTAKAFLIDQLNALAHHYDVSLIANFESNKEWTFCDENVKLINAPIVRKISLVRDVAALVELVKIFRKGAFEAVHSVTPKAGLLSMLAARFAGVRHRHHTFTGQVWATRTGFKRFLLKSLDSVTFRASTFCLVDSSSQRDFLIGEGVLNAARSDVLAHGSISGVDIVRFAPDLVARARLREVHGIHRDAFVFLYLGRLNREKGIGELVQAFSMLAGDRSRALMLVGPDEEGVLEDLRDQLSKTGGAVVTVGYTDEAESYMACADVFCLPSHREGFGTVVLEAAAAGLPAVGSRIYGVTDAIADGVTGLLHEKGNAEDLARKMQWLLDRPEIAFELGRNARLRVHEKFSNSRLTSAMVDFYQKKLG